MRRKTSIREGLAGLRSLLSKEDTGDRRLGALLAFGTFPLMAIVHAILGLHPTLGSLYLLPAWLCYRTGGRRLGVLALVFGAVVASVLDTRGFSLLDLALRLVVFLLIGLIVDQTLAHRVRAKDGPWDEEWSKGVDPDVPMIAVMIDCDGFMGLDDYYGDGAGHHAIDILVRVLENESRQSDMVARLSDREFVLVLHAVESNQAYAIMQRVQDRFEQRMADAGYECTISFGCAPVETEAQSIRDLLDQVESTGKRSVYLN